MTDRQFADRIPAPRPVPTTRDRLTAARTCDALCRDIEVERDDLRIQVGRLEADNRAMMRDRDQALVERDAARQSAGFATDVMATIRDAAERIDRALAAYDTTPGEGEPNPTELDYDVSLFAARWYTRPNDLIGGWCLVPRDQEPSSDVPSFAHFTSQPIAEHVAELHNRTFESDDSEDPPALGSLPPRAQDDLVDRLAAALAVAARTHDGSGVRPGTPDIWRAVLAEHADVRHLATHRRRGMFGRPAGTWRPASPGDTPGELTPEHGPTHPIQLAREQPAPVCSHGRSTFTPPTDGVPRHVDSWLPCDDYAPSEREG